VTETKAGTALMVQFKSEPVNQATNKQTMQPGNRKCKIWKLAECNSQKSCREFSNQRQQLSLSKNANHNSKSQNQARRINQVPR
jgi:hypothetical protein